MKKNALSSVKTEQNGFVRARDLLAKETLLALCALAVLIFISAIVGPEIGEDVAAVVLPLPSGHRGLVLAHGVGPAG